MVMKLIGGDFELANTLERAGHLDGRGDQAALLLLNEIRGYPRQRYPSGTMLEYGRRFLEGNGGSAYIDSNHLEMNMPEHLAAKDHVLHLHAALWLARQARANVMAGLPRGTRINVLANCGDGLESWGAHLNIMLDRQTFVDIHQRKPHLAGFVAAHLVSSVLYTGQGQVGAGNKRAACDYQLSQRADFFEEFAGIQTTHSRPLINLRAEHHCSGPRARMHIIYFDNVLCPLANRLKVGTMQLVLAMCEAGWADPTLQYDDPVAAAAEISRDMTLDLPLRTSVRGRAMTALEMQQALADLAGEFVASGAAANSVPNPDNLVDDWQAALQFLRQRDLENLAPRFDAWLKYLLLDRQRGRKGISWRSPDMKALDLMYASIDRDEGLFFQMARAGVVAEMPSDAEVLHAVAEPPNDTRAYLRAHVLRRFGEHISRMDWSHMDFRVPNRGSWWMVAHMPLPNPRGFGKEEADPILQRCANLDELVEAVGQATRADPTILPDGAEGLEGTDRFEGAMMAPVSRPHKYSAGGNSGHLFGNSSQANNARAWETSTFYSEE